MKVGDRVRVNIDWSTFHDRVGVIRYMENDTLTARVELDIDVDIPKAGGLCVMLTVIFPLSGLTPLESS